MKGLPLPPERAAEVIEASRRASHAVIAAACAAAGVASPSELDPETYVRVNEEVYKAALAVAWWDGARHRAAGIDEDPDLKTQWELESLCMAIVFALGLKGVKVALPDLERVTDAGFPAAWELITESNGHYMRINTYRR